MTRHEITAEIGIFGGALRVTLPGLRASITHAPGEPYVVLDKPDQWTTAGQIGVYPDLLAALKALLDYRGVPQIRPPKDVIDRLRESVV